MNRDACAMCWTLIITIKTVCFNMTSIFVCFNVSFLDFDHCLNDKGNFRSFELAFVPECYQYSCCSQQLISYDYMYFGDIQSNYNCFTSMFHLT